MFLYRDNGGATKSAGLSELESFTPGLEYLGVGGLWENFDIERIYEELLEASARR